MDGILYGLGLGFLVFTADFSKPDALFLQRENNPDAIAQAQALYETILNHSPDGIEGIRAMDQLGKLAYYEGELLTPLEASDKRKKIFAQTQALAEKAGSAYWKVLNLALWSKAAGPALAWWYIRDFKEAAQKALMQEPTTHGGGIYRLLAAVYVSSPVLGYYDLYQPQLALEYIEKALKIAPEHLECYFIKASVLKALGRIEEGKQLLKEQLASPLVFSELEPENKIILKRMAEKLQRWSEGVADDVD